MPSEPRRYSALDIGCLSGRNAQGEAVSVTDEALAKIREMISSGEFQPGDRLPKESDLAARLSVSRNSLREAIRALSLIHVVDVRQGDGTYVTSMEPELLSAGRLVRDRLPPRRQGAPPARGPTRAGAGGDRAGGRPDRRGGPRRPARAAGRDARGVVGRGVRAARRRVPRPDRRVLGQPGAGFAHPRGLRPDDARARLARHHAGRRGRADAG